MKKNIFFLLTLWTVVLLIAACGGASEPAAEQPAAGGEESAGGEPLKVVMVVNGVLGDKSFFDSAQRGSGLRPHIGQQACARRGASLWAVIS